MNRTAWLTFRGVTWLIAALGLLLYGFFIDMLMIDWRQNPYVHASRSTEIDFILFDVILGSGLAPLSIALYFFGRCNRADEWAAGLGFFVLFFFWHYVCCAFLAHAPWYTYQPMLIAGIVAAALVIFLWERKRSTNLAAEGQ